MSDNASQPTTTAPIAEEPADLTPRQRMVARMKTHRGLQFGAIVVGAMILVAIFAPLITPYDPYLQNLSKRLVPPVWQDAGSWAHIFGTDHLGRDYLSRLMYGAQVSLAIGFGAAGLGCIIGVTIGLAAGYLGGRIDQVASFLLTCQLALPSLLLAMVVLFFVGASVITVVVVLGCLHWTYYMVVTRAMTRQIRELEYVQAAHSIGSNN